MRQHLILAVLALPTAAAADKKSDAPAAIDVAPMAGKLDVFRDDTGMYYVSPSTGATEKDLDKWVFYGDGKTMYQQRVIGSSTDPHGRRTWILWSPRVRGIQNASIDLTPNAMVVDCTNHKEGKKVLTALAADEANTMIKHATFHEPLWKRTAHFLARDDDGTYYYVDELLDEYGGKGFRVFVGPKGAMKEPAMTNVVADSAGEIFATKTGELKIITGTDGTAFWKKGEKKLPLVVLELRKNRYLIYRELGIYGALGVVCDDQ